MVINIGLWTDESGRKRDTQVGTAHSKKEASAVKLSKSVPSQTTTLLFSALTCSQQGGDHSKNTTA